MQSNTDTALGLLFHQEGGFVNHPDDPGGPTNWGVTQATLKAHRGRPVTIADVRNLTHAEANIILKKGYLDPIKFDRLPSGLDYAVADFSVNSGPARAIKELQRLVGAAPDGILGEKTLLAIDMQDTADLIVRYCDARMAFLRGLKTFKTFGRGWTRRVTGKDPKGKIKPQLGVIGESLALLHGKKPLGIDPAPELAVAKARDVDRKLTSTVLGKIAATNITGIVTTGATSGIQWLASSGGTVGPALEQYGEVWSYLKYAGIALTVGGIIAATIATSNKNKEAGVSA